MLLQDLLRPIEGWEDEEMTVPVEMYEWPAWLPDKAIGQVNSTVDRLTREDGGLPAGLGAGQLVVVLGFGEAWQVAPQVDGLVDDEFGPGTVFQARVQLAQAVVRSWTSGQQVAGLLAVVAGCLLAVLPGDHGARTALEQAVADGAELLPAP